MIGKDNCTVEVGNLRRQAEKIAREKAAQSPENIEALSTDEIRQILHELRVHQIELEMQNEELRLAQVELDAARARYFNLYDLAPVSYCTLSEKGLILEGNLTAANLLGVVRSALIKQPITRFICKEDQDFYYLHRKQLFETRETQTCELRMMKQDGTTFWAHLEATAAQNADSVTVCRVMISDISKRKRIEALLLESEKRFSTLAALAPVGIYLCNSKGYCQYVNPRWCEMTGLSLEEALGNGWAKGLHPDDRESVFSNWRQMVASESQWGFEYRFQTPAGKVTWVHGLAAPQRDALGNIVAYVGICTDITERKQADALLEESEARYRQLFEKAPAGIYEVDLTTGRMLSVNDSMCEYTGYTKDELLTMNTLDLLTEESQKIFIERMAGYAAGKPVTANLEFKARSKSGREFWISINPKYFYKEGIPVRASVVAQDITERKQAEEKLRRYEHIVSNTQDTLLLLDKNFTYLSANTAFLRELGKTSDEVIGRTQSDVFGEAFFNTVIRPRAERCLAGENIRYQEWVEYPAAGRKYMDIAYSPYFGPDGEINGFVTTARDITEQENLKAQLIQAQKMESVGRLAGGVAHDFNNMLNVIIGFAEIAMEKVAPEDSLQADLAEIVSAGRRSVEITRQLLTFARKQAISPERIDLNETLESMLKMLRRLIGENIDLVFSPGSDLWPVLLDPSQVDQLLANLSVNARDAIADVGKIAIETKNVNIDKAFCADHCGNCTRQLRAAGCKRYRLRHGPGNRG